MCIYIYSKYSTMDTQNISNTNIFQIKYICNNEEVREKQSTLTLLVAMYHNAYKWNDRLGVRVLIK